MFFLKELTSKNFPLLFSSEEHNVYSQIQKITAATKLYFVSSFVSHNKEYPWTLLIDKSMELIFHVFVLSLYFHGRHINSTLL